MKCRKGFVSNSSSSSFVCDLTGNVEGGMDLCLTDIDMCSCEDGHEFMYDGYPKVEEWINSDANEDGNYNLPKELCPICNGDAKVQLVKQMKDKLKYLNLTVVDLT